MSDMFGIGSIVNNLIGQASHGSMSGSGTSVNNQSTSQTTNVSGTTSSGTNTGTSSTSDISGLTQSQTASLDPTTIAALRKLTELSSSGEIYSGATRGTVDDAATMAKSLGASAGGTRASIDDNYSDIAAAVTQNFNETQRVNTREQVAQYGNGDSSFAQLMKSKDDRALATSLAGVGAQLDVQGVTAQDNANKTALQANQLANTETSSLDSGRVALSTALANVLKGATTTSSTTANQSTTGRSDTSSSTESFQSGSTQNSMDTQGSTGQTMNQNTSSGSGLMGLFV